jgi:hypothetical protein
LVRRSNAEPTRRSAWSSTTAFALNNSETMADDTDKAGVQPSSVEEARGGRVAPCLGPIPQLLVTEVSVAASLAQSSVDEW